MSTNTDPLVSAAHKLRSSRAAAQQALEEAQSAAVAALAEGRTEVDVALLLGVSRQTVRKWAGKQ